MKIAVCIKQVPNSSQIKVDAVTHNLIRENAEMVVNPADLNALTEAIHIKELTGAAVDVFTMGIPEAEGALYTALAIGADQAYLVTDRAFAGCDSLGTAVVLCNAIKKVDDYDLILCGSLASDGATGQVGPMLAELLQLPSLSVVRGVESITDHQITASRNFRGKKLSVVLQLPCVLTVSLGTNVPILPTLRNQMKAKKKEIHVLTNQELAIPCEEVGTSGALSVVTDTYAAQSDGKVCEMLPGESGEIAKRIAELVNKAIES